MLKILKMLSSNCIYFQVWSYQYKFMVFETMWTMDVWSCQNVNHFEESDIHNTIAFETTFHGKSFSDWHISKLKSSTFFNIDFPNNLFIAIYHFKIRRFQIHNNNTKQVHY